jgi:hypothetical protein
MDLLRNYYSCVSLIGTHGAHKLWRCERLVTSVTILMVRRDRTEAGMCSSSPAERNSCAIDTLTVWISDEREYRR